MEKEKQKHNINNIFYAVIGVATLMIAVVGATFAYYTATASNDNQIKGNMATIGFDVTVTKVLKQDETRGGLIPMSNNMVQQALTKNASNAEKGICVDDNGNAVCQIYRINVVNSSTSSIFVDGYVTLSGGSGTPTDYPDSYYTNVTSKTINTDVVKNSTTMRWAQVFCTTETNGIVSGCSTSGKITVRPDSSTEDITLTALGGTSVKDDGINSAEILTTRTAIATDYDKANSIDEYVTIQKNDYEVINKNYIRLSNHDYGNNAQAKDYSYTRDIDPTSALVFNQFLEAGDNNATNNTGTSSGYLVDGTYKGAYTDSQVYYIVVWLSETGTNQTAKDTNAGNPAKSGEDFFQGNATFVTAEGNEVTATFSGHLQVEKSD